MKRLPNSAISLTQPEPSNLKALRDELGRRWPMTGLGFVKDALRRLDVIVGQKKAMAIAVKGRQTRRRWSKLKEWLQRDWQAQGRTGPASLPGAE